MFFVEFFHLPVEQTNVYYQQHLARQARPRCWLRLPDITFPDMMNFTALALQMGKHIGRHTTWLLFEARSATQSVFWWDHDTRQIFTHTTFSAFCRQFTYTWQRRRICLTMETKDRLRHNEWDKCKIQRQCYCSRKGKFCVNISVIFVFHLFLCVAYIVQHVILYLSCSHFLDDVRCYGKFWNVLCPRPRACPRHYSIPRLFRLTRGHASCGHTHHVLHNIS